MKTGSSIPKTRNRLSSRVDGPQRPLNPDTETPSAESELQKLAETSGGTSPYSGYRGLLPNRDRHNHENFSLGTGLEYFNSDRDQHPASVLQFQREQARQEHLQTSLDKSVGGPSGPGRGKSAKLDGGEAGRPEALYR